MSCTITVEEFKEQFDRGQFTYSETLPGVRDKDIESAISEAEATFNGDLYSDDPTCKQALLYLTAHFLTNDIESANSGGQPVFIQGSRSADGISESVIVPDWMSQGDFSMYATTYYGQKFLTLSKPYMDGAVYVVGGATLP